MASLPPDPTIKIQIAKEKKEAADQAFKTGDLQTALLNYHEAMMYLHGLDKNMLSAMSSNSGSSGPAPLTSTPTEETTEVSTPGVKDSGNERPKDKDGKELNEVDDLLAKIYSNQSACHMKKGNWKRAVETAEKALAKNPSNYKAQFRKGKAQAELGYVEKALATLEDLLNKDASEKASIMAEIAHIKAVDKERERKHNQKFKGFLNRTGKGVSYNSTPTESTTSVGSTATASTTASEASTVPVKSGLSPAMTTAKLSSSKPEDEVSKPLEPSGLVEVSEEEFERAKKGRG